MKEEIINANIWDLLHSSLFEIGGEDQLAKLKQEFKKKPTDDQGISRLNLRWNEFKKNSRIQIGTLLKTDNVSFLLGAGSSKYAGGLLLGSIPLEIEKDLAKEGTDGEDIHSWLKIFYQMLNSENPIDPGIPKNVDQMLNRLRTLDCQEQIRINLEKILTKLFQLRGAIPERGSLRLGGDFVIEVDSNDLETCIVNLKKSLARHCMLPSGEAAKGGPQFHIEFLRRILTRPLNLKRIDLFTLNYDNLIEQAADAGGVVLMDGFLGTIRRVFRPESYDQDLYFPAETTEGRVHRFDKVIHLYKLHGSINWKTEEPEWNNPYGVSTDTQPQITPLSPLIFPTPAKYGETLGLPYTELFRRFAASIVRPQSTLFIIGYGFGDEHVNTIIRQALTIPSFTIVIINPSEPVLDDKPQTFVGRLRAQNDRRVWIVSGRELGSFEGFVNNLLPDLRDQEILQKVIGTHRALGMVPDESTEGRSTHDS